MNDPGLEAYSSVSSGIGKDISRIRMSLTDLTKRVRPSSSEVSGEPGNSGGVMWRFGTGANWETTIAVVASRVSASVESSA